MPAPKPETVGFETIPGLIAMKKDGIIVTCFYGHWSANWLSSPEMAFGGATPAEAVDRLHFATSSQVTQAELHESDDDSTRHKRF